MPKHKRATPDVYKIVYVGPVGSGKRTNVAQIAKLFDGSPLVQSDETTVPDSIVIGVPAGTNFSKRLSVHTLPHEITSPIWLSLMRDLHGVVFVADSEQGKYEANIKAMTEFIGKLAYFRLKIEAFPFIIQYNKRDVDGAISIPRFEDELNPFGLAAFNAVASDGTGVGQCLKSITYLVEKHIAG